jgi:hypothetical protein
MWPFLTSPEVRWYEKCDRLLASVMMMSPFLFLAAIITSTASGFYPSRLLGGASNVLAPSLGLRVMIWSTLAGWVCPLLPACLHMWRKPTRLARYVGACILVHLAMAPTLAAGVLRTLVTGRTTFPVTGDRGGTSHDAGWRCEPAAHEAIDSPSMTCSCRRAAAVQPFTSPNWSCVDHGEFRSHGGGSLGP